MAAWTRVMIMELITHGHILDKFFRMGPIELSQWVEGGLREKAEWRITAVLLSWETWSIALPVVEEKVGGGGFADQGLRFERAQLIMPVR